LLNDLLSGSTNRGRATEGQSSFVGDLVLIGVQTVAITSPSTS
jgi:hypothetical protein